MTRLRVNLWRGVKRGQINSQHYICISYFVTYVVFYLCFIFHVVWEVKAQVKQVGGPFGRKKPIAVDPVEEPVL
jgi:hypothetical protein